MNNLQKLILIFILLSAFVLRFYKLNDIPSGILADEASQGYNAYSILHTGKDMYGKSMPVLFRANGSFQPPIYTYLSVIPVAIFGNTIFSIRFVSAVSGVVLVLFTFLLLRNFGIGSVENKTKFALMAALLLSVSPWAIHFSRLAVEANLALAIFSISLYFFFLSVKKRNYFLLACLILGISIHAYYSERFIALIFLPVFLFIYRNVFLKQKKIVLIGFLVLVFTQIPNLLIIKSGVLTTRFSQVSYFSDPKIASSTPINKSLLIGSQFLNHYTAYFSPKNLFLPADSTIGKIAPDLGIYYSWLFIPFLFGLGFVVKNRKDPLFQIFGFLMLISPIPAALTGDAFYPLRTLELFWILTIVISGGVIEIWNTLNSNFFKVTLFGSLFVYSIFVFFVSYFVLFKIENSNDFGYPYVKLVSILPKYKDNKITMDFTDRAWGEGIRMAYLTSMNPNNLQLQLKSQLKGGYYGNDSDPYEEFIISNITVKKLDWSDACQKNTIMVGDRYSISDAQAISHGLTLEFVIDNLVDNQSYLFGWRTNPTKTLCSNI